MNDTVISRQPVAVADIVAEAEALSFNMMSEAKVGALLAVLAASKPGGHLLELGTGTGHGTAWLPRRRSTRSIRTRPSLPWLGGILEPTIV